MSAPGDAARRQLRRARHGILSTLSRRLGGYPFGSVVPIVLDAMARPVMLMSALAEHTKNIAADPRSSLIAHDAAADVQATGRVTVVGNTRPWAADPDFRARYLRYLPEAGRLLELGDFAFQVLEPVAVRYIAGFGAIEWIPPESYAPPENRLAEAEADIVAHMNAEHAHHLLDYCRTVHGAEVAAPEMVGIDCDGFDVRADALLLRFDFDAPVMDAASARDRLVALARQCKRD